MGFFSDVRHWNSVANLHLLNDSQNLSKKDKPLKSWLEAPGMHLDAASLLAGGASLEFEAFKDFYSKRRDALRTRLVSRVYMTSSLTIDTANDDFDEEVVEESKA